MEKIVTYSFCDSFLDRFVDDLERDYIKGQSPVAGGRRDLSRLAIVFGGRRPALFVKRALSRKIGSAFFPPRFFSIDEFMGHIVSTQETVERARDMDQCYLMFRLVKKHCPGLLKNRESFARFLPWAQEILSFIEQLDLECVKNDQLKGVEQNARIGYDVPADVNRILSEIVILRGAYHAHMRETGMYTRGFQYRRAAELITQTRLDEFDDIVFANFFYFNRAEEAVVRTLYDAGRARLFFQGDQRRWPVFERISKILKTQITEGKEVPVPAFDLKLYRGFDTHSQVCQLREILKTISDLKNTVIVLPDPGNIIPLLSEIGPVVKDFNISLGYPLKRSSLVSLLEQVFKAQGSRDDRGYYAHDYLNVLKHPLIKNLMLFDDAQIVRVLVHKLEEALTGAEDSSISGCLFLTLDAVVSSSPVIESAHEMLVSMGHHIAVDDLIHALRVIHQLCFLDWEQVENFEIFAGALRGFLDFLVEKSVLRHYPLNIRIASKIYDIADELLESDCAREQFSPEELFRIFSSRMDREIVSFIGSPLKGLQILGLFETRSLNFDHVIIMDTNEGVLPHLNIYEALIPRDVMISLNLDRLEQEEEIQRYGFMRLISSAKTVHLLYQESRDRERSRFIEELVWEHDKAQAVAGQSGIGGVPVIRCGFPIRARAQKRTAQKTPQMIEFLRNYRYSASSINLYLKNPMDFYHQHVLGLREQEDLLDEPENRQVGIFVHDLLEAIFKRFAGKPLVIDKAFVDDARGVLHSRFQDFFEKSRRPDVFLMRRVIETRFDQFLEREAGRAGMIDRVECLEKKFDTVIPLACGEIGFRCVVDRIDRMKDGRLLILDYKTGHIAHLFPKDLSEVEAVAADREAIQETVRSFQLPLYFYSVRREFPGTEVDAGLYDLRTQEIKTFLGKKTGDDARRIEQAFLRALDYVVREILDPDMPFVETEGKR